MNKSTKAFWSLVVVSCVAVAYFAIQSQTFFPDISKNTGDAEAAIQKPILHDSALAAKTVCPSYIKHDIERINLSHYVDSMPPGIGYPLGTKITATVWNSDKSKKRFYRFPLGYRTGWATSAHPDYFDPSEIIEGASFTFWMPEKRYPEMPFGYSVSTKSHGCEHGRPIPTDENYLVTFRVGHIGMTTMRREPLVWSKKLKNVELEFGLWANTSYGHKSKTIPHYKPLFKEQVWASKVYQSLSSQAFQLYFSCSNKYEKLCNGQFYFPEKKLSVSATFLSKNMKDWKKIKDSILDFLEEWEIETPK